MFRVKFWEIEPSKIVRKCHGWGQTKIIIGQTGIIIKKKTNPVHSSISKRPHPIGVKTCSCNQFSLSLNILHENQTKYKKKKPSAFRISYLAGISEFHTAV